VRLKLMRERASAELDLGEAARFYPSDAALERWRAGAHEGRATVVYD
jgi:DNA polymerase-3 subunit alpha